MSSSTIDKTDASPVATIALAARKNNETNDGDSTEKTYTPGIIVKHSPQDLPVVSASDTGTIHIVDIKPPTASKRTRVINMILTLLSLMLIVTEELSRKVNTVLLTLKVNVLMDDVFAAEKKHSYPTGSRYRKMFTERGNRNGGTVGLIVVTTFSLLSVIFPTAILCIVAFGSVAFSIMLLLTAIVAFVIVPCIVFNYLQTKVASIITLTYVAIIAAFLGTFAQMA